MGFRTRMEPNLACDPLSSISLAFLSFTEETNMHEINEVEKHQLGRREGTRQNRPLQQGDCKNILPRRKGKIVLMAVFVSGNILLTYPSEPMYCGRSHGN